MKSISKQILSKKEFVDKQVFVYALIIVSCCILITIFVIQPIWHDLDLHVPGEINTKIDFTQPVDSIFYVRNAEWGYRWDANTPTSLWFHPLLSFLMKILNLPIGMNYRLWLISVIAACLSLPLVYEYAKYISSVNIKPIILLAAPIIPGGIEMAIGNAEFLCLVFTTLLALSVIREKAKLPCFIFGALAIFAKPNAIYMIPALCIYLLAGIHKKRNSLVGNSLLGILGITLGWIAWIIIVDMNTNQWGAYWSAREVASVPLTQGSFTFLERSIRMISFSQNQKDILMFSTSILIPLVDLWILAVIPIKDETHRVAIIANIFALMTVTFLINNPNKIIVYSLTFPGHLALGFLFLQQTFEKRSEKLSLRIVRNAAGISYIAFGITMVLFYIIGTPLEWYY